MRLIYSHPHSDVRPRWALAVLAFVLLALAPTARAEEPGEILMRAISAGEKIVAGEVTITRRRVDPRDGAAGELKAGLVGKLAFDIPNGLLRWSRHSASEPKDTPQHTIETPSDWFYQQGDYLRIKLLAPYELNREKSPIDVRIIGRASMHCIEDRDNLPKVMESFNDAKFRLMDRLKEDDDSIVTVARINPTVERTMRDKSVTRLHSEARYQIDTKRNVITQIQVVNVNEDNRETKLLNEERFTWEEIDGFSVPVKCQLLRSSEGRVNLEFALEWASVNSVDEARFRLSDLPPLSKDGVFIDDVARAKLGIFPPEKARPPKAKEPEAKEKD